MTDEAEREEEFQAASALGQLLERTEPRAVRAEYDAERGVVMIQLRSGCWFGFPPTADPYLRDATPEQLAQVEVWWGDGLHWEELDADISVPGVIFHELDVPAWAPRWLATSADCPECLRRAADREQANPHTPSSSRASADSGLEPDCGNGSGYREFEVKPATRSGE
jgi:hypothetical protein